MSDLDACRASLAGSFRSSFGSVSHFLRSVYAFFVDSCLVVVPYILALLYFRFVVLFNHGYTLRSPIGWRSVCPLRRVLFSRVLLDKGLEGVDVKKHNLFFSHGDILSAKTFDPFTHVYMFDIGELGPIVPVSCKV